MAHAPRLHRGHRGSIPLLSTTHCSFRGQDSGLRNPQRRFDSVTVRHFLMPDDVIGSIADSESVCERSNRSPASNLLRSRITVVHQFWELGGESANLSSATILCERSVTGSTRGCGPRRAGSNPAAHPNSTGDSSSSPGFLSPKQNTVVRIHHLLPSSIRRLYVCEFYNL
jgi:hypothetical protein